MQLYGEDVKHIAYSAACIAGADLGFYDPSERGTGRRAPKARRGWDLGSIGCTPSEKICVFLISKYEFYAFPVIFIDTVTANRHVSKICSFQKRAR